MSLKASFVSYLLQKYPDLNPSLVSDLVSDQLLSPFQVSLSVRQIETLKKEINAYWELRNWGDKNLSSQYEKYGLRKPANYSVCMSYDFHINSQGEPELIEVNTNAAFLALGLELYSFLNLKNPAGEFKEKNLLNMFTDEIDLCGKSDRSIAIVDENPSTQRLYLEFLIYKNIFLKNNINAEILNTTDVQKMSAHSLVYNRYTDFYLQDEKSAEIKKLFNSGEINLSPHPYEYFLTADKQRLLDWNQQTDIQLPKSLLKIYNLGKEDSIEMWEKRKNLFFKPKNSYGGKQAYRGASMSRKAFESVLSENFVAQQMSVPSHINVEYNEKPLELKYDLRCFVYKNDLQLIIARLYQGQITNLQTPGGGFAAVRIN